MGLNAKGALCMAGLEIVGSVMSGRVSSQVGSTLSSFSNAYIGETMSTVCISVAGSSTVGRKDVLVFATRWFVYSGILFDFPALVSFHACVWNPGWPVVGFDFIQLLMASELWNSEASSSVFWRKRFLDGRSDLARKATLFISSASVVLWRHALWSLELKQWRNALWFGKLRCPSFASIIIGDWFVAPHSIVRGMGWVSCCLIIIGDSCSVICSYDSRAISFRLRKQLGFPIVGLASETSIELRWWFLRCSKMFLSRLLPMWIYFFSG